MYVLLIERQITWREMEFTLNAGIFHKMKSRIVSTEVAVISYAQLNPMLNTYRYDANVYLTLCGGSTISFCFSQYRYINFFGTASV